MSSSSLKQEKREKEKELKEWKKRLDQVEDIQRNLSRVMEDKISDVNGQIDKLTSQLGPAIKNITYISDPCDTAYDMRENEWESNLSDTKSSLSKEVRDVNDKINNLNREISNLEVRIQQAEAAEEEERRRQWEEMMSRLNPFD